MPSPRPKPTFQPAVSDAAVEAKTGKRWRQWFDRLDQAGARSWDHKTIAKSLHEDYGLTFWWAQTVTVGYEQAVGLRAKHEMPDGYQIQRQRVAAVSDDTAWRAIADPALRKLWVPEVAEAGLRRQRDEKRQLHLDWDGFESERGRILIGVLPKGESKCSVGVMHSKLTSAEAAEAAKAFWAERLDRLVEKVPGSGAKLSSISSNGNSTTTLRRTGVSSRCACGRSSDGRAPRTTRL